MKTSWTAQSDLKTPPQTYGKMITRHSEKMEDLMAGNYGREAM